MSSVETFRANYESMFGFLPPRVKQRMEMGDEIDPKLLDLVENTRLSALDNAQFDAQTTQLMVFGILLSQLSNGAGLHAIAAKRAGATKAELHAVASLVFLYRGMSAFNMGVEMINNAFKN